MDRDNKGVVLLVDGDRFVLDAASMLLGIHGYRVIMCEEAGEADKVLGAGDVDVVLADMKMAGAGFPGLVASALPVLLMCGHEDVDAALDAVQKGAFDMVIKPYRPEYLLIKIERAIEHANLKRLEKLYQATLEDTVRRSAQDLARVSGEAKGESLEMIGRLAGAAEFRDSGPVRHASRVSLYAGMIAEQMGLPAGFVGSITFAAAMHDIGMAGVDNAVLFKAAPLTASEFEAVKTHTMTGHRLLDGSSGRDMKMAATVALTHHERWDGSGYPYGLKGSEIPLEGMITRICDQYDALRSPRPHRGAFSHSESVRIITAGNAMSSPAHHHPLVMEAFRKLAPGLDEVFAANQDSAGGSLSPRLARTS